MWRDVTDAQRTAQQNARQVVSPRHPGGLGVLANVCQPTAWRPIVDNSGTI